VDASNSSEGMPFLAEWNGTGINGNTDLTQTVTSPGTYQLVITNTDNGCTQSESITVIENVAPPIVTINGNEFLDCETATTFSITDLRNGCNSTGMVAISPDPGGPTDAIFDLERPSCFGEDDGAVVIDTVIGGVGPFLFSFGDNNSYAATNQFGRLEAGTYPISIQDVNGCAWSTEITLDQPNEFVVSLGEDQEILLGDSLRLFGAFSNPVDTFFWSDTSFLSCNNCVDPFVKPENTSQVILTAIDENGCESLDILLLSVDKERKIYIPSAFSPNGDGQNDRFTIYGGNGIVEVEYLQVFNRWGALVFEERAFPVNAEPLGWNGSFKGDPAENGVYIYQMKVVFVDGFEMLYQGDVTIMR